MAEDGIVGPYNGSQAREVLITLAQWEAQGPACDAVGCPALGQIKQARAATRTLGGRKPVPASRWVRVFRFGQDTAKR